MYIANYNVRIKRHVYKKDDVITTEMTPEMAARLLLLGAIRAVASAQPAPAPVKDIMPDPIVEDEDDGAEAFDEDPADIDATEGIVTEPEKPKKRGGRRGK